MAQCCPNAVLYSGLGFKWLSWKVAYMAQLKGISNVGTSASSFPMVLKVTKCMILKSTSLWTRTVIFKFEARTLCVQSLEQIGEENEPKLRSERALQVKVHIYSTEIATMYLRLRSLHRLMIHSDHTED
ncbi:hypothetical protein VNO77_15702 [Canavalia gladiata]|uniref:Uncharacterized protein n=1 Tax=Canavalia gladiata TaxID=3824 RepID=A0AAN9QSH3_CANGL